MRRLGQRTDALRILAEAALLPKDEPSGVERYAHEMLLALARLPISQIRLAVLSSGPGLAVDNDPSLVGYIAKGKRWKIREVDVPRIAKALGVELILHFSVAPGFRHPRPFVMVVHDTVPWDRPESIPLGMTVYGKPSIECSLRSHNLRGVVVPSQHTRRRIRELGLVPSRVPVVVIYPGISGTFCFRPSPQAGRRGSSPYVVGIGTLEPRKNVGLADAIAAKLIPHGIEFHWVGKVGWRTSVADFKHLRFLGRIDDTSLAEELSGAVAYVSTSLEEGFGIPVLEAMASGTPTVLSALPVFKEITGEAGCFVRSVNPTAWARAILEIIGWSEARRQSEADRLTAAAARYSYERSAAQLLDFCQRVASPSRDNG